MQWNVWITPEDSSALTLLARTHGARRESLDLPIGAGHGRVALVVVGVFERATKEIVVGGERSTLARFLEASRRAAGERCYFFDLACEAAVDPFAAADLVADLLAHAADGEGWVVALRGLPLVAPHPLVRWLDDRASESRPMAFDDAYELLASSSFSGLSAPALGRATPRFAVALGGEHGAPVPVAIGSARDLAAVADEVGTPRPPTAEMLGSGAVDESPVPPAPASMSIDIDVDLTSGSHLAAAPASSSGGALVDLTSLPQIEAALSGPNLEIAARGSWAPWEEEAAALAAAGFREASWSPRLEALAERAALEPRRVEALLMRLVESFAREGLAHEAGLVCRRLAVLRRDALSDIAGAIDAFRGAIRCLPTQAENHRGLAELLGMGVDPTLAATCLDESIGALGPELEFLVLRRSAFARLDPERATLAGAFAVAFGDARFQPDADALVAHAPLRPARGLGAAERALVRHPAMAEDVSAIFGVVERAALEMRADEKRLPPLDPATALDPSSTVTIVRTVTWAAQVLGLPPVPVHHVETTRHDLIAHPGPPACVVVGPRATTGRSLVELSFLAARHLAYYLPGHRVSLQFVSVDELAMLFWAALLAVREEIPPALREATATMRWRDGLRTRLSPSERAELGALVARFEAAGGRVDLTAWVRGLELTANRLGLLLAGDPSRVVAMVRNEDRRVGGLEAQARLTDLALWGASEAHARLRRDLLTRA